MEITSDPVADLIVAGPAFTVDEAEELYLSEHLGDVIALCSAPLTDDEFRRHPLIALLFARGSRAFEDDPR